MDGAVGVEPSHRTELSDHDRELVAATLADEWHAKAALLAGPFQVSFEPEVHLAYRECRMLLGKRVLLTHTLCGHVDVVGSRTDKDVVCRNCKRYQRNRVAEAIAWPGSLIEVVPWTD